MVSFSCFLLAILLLASCQIAIYSTDNKSDQDKLNRGTGINFFAYCDYADRGDKKFIPVTLYSFYSGFTIFGTR